MGSGSLWGGRITESNLTIDNVHVHWARNNLIRNVNFWEVVDVNVE